MTADKKLQADLRKLRDLGTQLAAKGNELMKLGVEVQRLVDTMGKQMANTAMVVPAESRIGAANVRPGKIVSTEE